MQAKLFYKPELDALRFFAFLAVLIHHTFPWTPSSYPASLPRFLTGVLAATARAGGYGVDLFFCLSAYLITSLLIREVNASGRLAVAAFWIRRSLRIWPLYFAFVLAAFIAGRFSMSPRLPRGIPPCVPVLRRKLGVRAARPPRFHRQPVVECLCRRAVLPSVAGRVVHREVETRGVRRLGDAGLRSLHASLARGPRSRSRCHLVQHPRPPRPHRRRNSPRHRAGPAPVAASGSVARCRGGGIGGHSIRLPV